MNGRLLFCILVSAAACSAPRQAERAPRVPPLAIDQPVVQWDPGSRTDAEESAPAPLTEVQFPESQSTGSPSAESHSTGSHSSGPIYRTVTRVVETPPVEQQSTAASEPAAASGEAASQPRSYQSLPPHVSFHTGVYCDPACGFFPVHTVIGTSIGAAIGAHHGDPHHGAMIGGTIGFFLDMGRAFH
jgi:hypothetical protein